MNRQVNIEQALAQQPGVTSPRVSRPAARRAVSVKGQEAENTSQLLISAVIGFSGIFVFLMMLMGLLAGLYDGCLHGMVSGCQ